MTLAATTLFNAERVRLHRQRSLPRLHHHDFLMHHVGVHLLESFGHDLPSHWSNVLEIGWHDHLESSIKKATSCNHYTRIDLLEPFFPLPQAQYNLVFSNLALHWIHHLPQCFQMIRHTLKPQGLFVASLWGGETLRELRTSLHHAEMELLGGISPRISPFTLVKDAGQLLHHAGFNEPVSASDSLTVMYPNLLGLLHDLRGMGESNALTHSHRSCPPREFFAITERYYRTHYGDTEGNIPATFDSILLTGWNA